MIANQVLYRPTGWDESKEETPEDPKKKQQQKDVPVEEP